jgi:hypothetical protein
MRSYVPKITKRAIKGKAERQHLVDSVLPPPLEYLLLPRPLAHQQLEHLGLLLPPHPSALPQLVHLELLLLLP